VRELGYAVADEELAVGIIAIASAIGAPGGIPVGTLSISAPRVRLTDDLVVPHGRLARDTAARITAYDPDKPLWGELVATRYTSKVSSAVLAQFNRSRAN
jgi:hypothetical protein